MANVSTPRLSVSASPPSIPGLSFIYNVSIPDLDRRLLGAALSLQSDPLSTSLGPSLSHVADRVHHFIRPSNPAHIISSNSPPLVRNLAFTPLTSQISLAPCLPSSIIPLAQAKHSLLRPTEAFLLFHGYENALLTFQRSPLARSKLL